MALENAKLILNLNRQRGTFAVDELSSNIYSQDANVSLVVIGFTLDEVTKTQGKTPYEPYFRISDEFGSVLAECKLEPAATPTPTEAGNYAMFGSLSTNTDKMAVWFKQNGAAQGCPYSFDAKVYSTTEANPISTGTVYIYAFGRSSGHAPSNLPSASEVLAALNTKVDNHIASVSNPHQVTAAQVGAPTLAYADGTYATQSALATLQGVVNSANAAILALQSAMQTANLAIQSNTVALSGKANIANTYRKDETYAKGEVDYRISLSSASRLLVGKTFATPTNDKERTNLICYILRELGGNVNVSGITPGTAPTQITLTANDGTSRNVKVVKVDGEYTTEVN